MYRNDKVNNPVSHYYRNGEFNYIQCDVCHCLIDDGDEYKLDGKIMCEKCMKDTFEMHTSEQLTIHDIIDSYGGMENV